MGGPTTRNLTIMLTDIKDFTAQTSKRSRAEIQLMLERHKEVLLPVLEARGGRLVKTLGDAFLMAFESPTDAVLAGAEAQGAIKLYNDRTGTEHHFEIRIALNQGEVNLADNDVFGDPVNIAARLEEVCEPGEVYFTDAVYLSMNKREVRSCEVGLFEFKGVADKVRVYKVGRGPAGPPAAAEVNVKLERPVAQSAAPPPPASPASAPRQDWGSGPMNMGTAEELIGQDVGPCRIEAILGRGGMGVVYQGRHKRLDRPVAVKVIIPSIHRSAGASELLLQEARLVARLEDSRIVQVYDVGRQGQLSFVVMQLIRGENLGDRVIRQGKLSQKEALAMMREVLLGLSAAHRQGIVHRDLKPSNIMIDETGAVKLLDFGIAGVTGNEEFTPDASFSGTLDFMAPEQSFGAKADPRMDLYSFGATYFFALTGMPPFTGNTAVEVLLKHRDAPVPDVRQVNREITAAAAGLISRLMSKFPEGRPASAEEVLKELEKPGMVMEVDASGSPFKILPPPVEPAVGFAAELAATQLPGAQQAPAFLAPGVPPPPPPVDFLPGRIPLPTIGLFGVLFAAFFGSSWSSVVFADWLAAGVAATASTALLALSKPRSRLLRLSGVLLICAAGLCFYRFGTPPGEGFPPPVPGFDTLVLFCVGVILAGAGIFLGFLSSQTEGDLSAGLLAAAGGVLLVAGVARGLPESTGWLSGLSSRLLEGWQALSLTGGLWRWAGLPVLYGARRFARAFEFDPEDWSRRKTADGRIINWNK
ncbi:MAG: protein kinase [Elusimicrobia bacterium]|nr:protein kinase [Elusimicrobiota bacterium]